MFHTQVRIGAPLNITGLTDYAQEPYYSTAVGLLHYGKESHLNGEAEEKNVLQHQLARGSGDSIVGCEKSFIFMGPTMITASGDRHKSERNYV